VTDVSVLLADDQPLMRAALRTCLEDDGFTVVAEVGDGAEAVRETRRLRPDVVVMDVRMPVVDGIEATRQIVAMDDSTTRVLMMTTFDLDEYIIDALRAGASGFLVKDSTPDELLHAVRVIASGQALLSPAITRRLLDLRARTLPPVSPQPPVELARITVRELAVLELVARGWSNADIATALSLAQSSVKSHVGHLLAKLGMRDRIQLVIFAYDHGMVGPGAEPRQ
jgi:DNA-binding NarL/FixJ family response regulator